MEQVKPFNTALGGTTPNLCLANVTAGYSIPNKYASAWEAWEHTQQHTGDPPPDLDVPLFYSYTATIDGVTENYGHINVRLQNGTVWSDGNIYSSIDAYEANHTPKYVGWGESVNDVIVIKGGNMPYVDQTVLDGLEAWKVTGQKLSFDAAYPAMGGTAGNPLVVVQNGKVIAGNTDGIDIVMNDFRANKAANIDAQPYKQFVAVQNAAVWESVNADLSQLKVVRKDDNSIATVIIDGTTYVPKS
jgi:hypothetical protein